MSVLLVPALAKNLLSIGQLTNDYPYNYEFYGVDFVIKERETNHILMSKRQKGNLHTLSAPYVIHFFTQFRTTS